jgi:alpha-mannosidase
VFTDGDLRRLIEAGADLRGLTARDVMGPEPRTIRADALAVEAAELKASSWGHQQGDIHPEYLLPTGYGDGGGGPTAEMCERAGPCLRLRLQRCC